MNFINLFIDNKKRNVSFTDVNEKFESILMSARSTLLMGKLIALYKYARTKPVSVKNIGGRAYLINGEFVYKHDEQFKANELSFISNLFAQACKVKCPNMILTTREDFIDKDSNDKLAQIMEYRPDWSNYSPEHPRSKSFVKQLARLLAFDLVAGNSDHFLFIDRIIDNIIFANDPEYGQMDLWDSPILNEGNFGFVGDDLWSLDHRANDDMSFILKIHKLLDKEFLSTCTRLMAKHFKLSSDEESVFRSKLSKYVARNLKLFPKFKVMHDWVMDE